MVMHYLVLSSRLFRRLLLSTITICAWEYYLVTETTKERVPALYKVGTTESRLQSQTVTFRDGPKQWTSSMSSGDDPLRYHTVHDDVSLSDFFARPIPIANFTWTPGGTFTPTSINPWQLFIINPRVANRISNYKLFSGKLHVKFMVNGNSFYYGRLMAYYEPLYLSDGASVSASSSFAPYIGSQKLKLFIDPSESQGGEMEMPFLWHADMVDLPRGDYTQLGSLTLLALNDLKHANAATAPITVVLYAWMEDVKLAAPTATDVSGIVAQAGDESPIFEGRRLEPKRWDHDTHQYVPALPNDPIQLSVPVWYDGQIRRYDFNARRWTDCIPDVDYDTGSEMAMEEIDDDDEERLCYDSIVPQADEYGTSPVSAVASALSRAANAMSSVPIIGRYMRATSIASGAMASIASLFGFSRPTNISTPVLMRARNLGELAVTDVPDTVNKLSVDSKQELAIDPRILGVSHGDEMVVADIAARESLIDIFPWATSATINTCIFSVRPNPGHYLTGTGTLGTTYYLPACTYAALPFKYWRGSMKYRFQIVASAYHKGRLMFMYDPNAGATPEPNVQYTKIVDISAERDFVIDIPWSQTTTWKQVQFLQNNYITNGSGYGSAEQTYTNGVLAVYVMNELASPNNAINNDIAINVYVSMCDAEFAAPNDNIQTLSIVTQSDIETEMETTNNAPQQEESTESVMKCEDVSDTVSVVFMGERIRSFRQLVKRYATDWVWAPISAAAGYSSFTVSDFPMKRGYTADGLQSGATQRYNTPNTTMMRYLSYGFLCYRGGIRRKYLYINGANDTASTGLFVKRNTSTAPTTSITNTTFVVTNAVAYATQALSILPSGNEGQAAISIKQNQCLEVEMPYYTWYRFSVTRRPYVNLANNPSYIEDLTHTVTFCNSAVNNTALVALVAGAEDSAFFCFQGCGLLYKNPTFT